MNIPDLWYRNAIVYCLDVSTFMDGDGDGVGDFEGLMGRLDYLANLGVTCLWLLPFYRTPNRDNGYDVTDHYAVDARHGSLGDFVEFAHQARVHGFRLLVDLVVNHTSDEHPWFQAARRDPRSRYRDWYVLTDEEPKDRRQGMVFPGVQDETWTWDEEGGFWYFHRFYAFQPDLDIEHPAVREEIRRIMGCWLELGVSGFRVDAVPFLIERVRPDAPPGPPDVELLHQMREFLQWRVGDAILLAEANVAPERIADFMGERGDRLHLMFNFLVNQYLFHALATGEVAKLAKALEDTRPPPGPAQWAHFLRNHDELDLARLTDEERQQVFEAFGPEPEMQLYGRGLRRRLAPMLGGDRRRLEMAYSLLFALPGTPVLNYGDEIGMGEDPSLPERQATRTPMQWSSARHGGFTVSDEPVLPVVSGGDYGFERVNMVQQARDPGSLLSWMERMIRVRKDCPEVGWGDFTVLDAGSPHVLGLEYAWKGSFVVALHNFVDRPQPIVLEPACGPGAVLIDLTGCEDAEADDDGRHRVTLGPYGYRWFRAGGLDGGLLRIRAR